MLLSSAHSQGPIESSLFTDTVDLAIAMLGWESEKYIQHSFNFKSKSHLWSKYALRSLFQLWIVYAFIFFWQVNNGTETQMAK